jgi:hypothetical protein
MATLPPIPKFILRWVLLYGPWPKGRTPTNPEAVARERYDFTAEQSRCLQLIDRVASRELSTEWPVNSTAGTMTGRQWSQLQARHLDHHLRQFGA